MFCGIHGTLATHNHMAWLPELTFLSSVLCTEKLTAKHHHPCYVPAESTTSLSLLQATHDRLMPSVLLAQLTTRPFLMFFSLLQFQEEAHCLHSVLVQVLKVIKLPAVHSSEAIHLEHTTASIVGGKHVLISTVISTNAKVKITTDC
jgi:late competence protein required for DNA uptake (superfamily II DNA/RNA helicase)